MQDGAKRLMNIYNNTCTNRYLVHNNTCMYKLTILLIDIEHFEKEHRKRQFALCTGEFFNS